MNGKLKPKRVQVNTDHLPLWRIAKGKSTDGYTLTIQELLRKREAKKEERKGTGLEAVGQRSFLHRFFPGKHRFSPALEVQAAIEIAQRKKGSVLTVGEAIVTDMKRQKVEEHPVDAVKAAKNIYFYSTAGNPLEVKMTESAKIAQSKINRLMENKHFQGRVQKSGLGSFSLACVELEISLADRITLEAVELLTHREKLIGKKADKEMKQLAVTNATINTYQALEKEEKYFRKQRV